MNWPTDRQLTALWIALLIGVLALLRRINGGELESLPLEQRWPRYSVRQKLLVLLSVAIIAVAVVLFFRQFVVQPTL